MDLGFELTGDYRILLANDLKDFMVKTYEANFRAKGGVGSSPKVVLGDVAGLEFDGLEADVVIGGPPCQDFSVLRAATAERQGIAVRRGRLYAHFVRALVRLKPKAFVFENVPGLVTANRGVAYKVILEDLANLELRWDEVKRCLNKGAADPKVPSYRLIFKDVVNASHFGVPQNRKRLIIVGVRSDLAAGRNPLELSLIFRRAMGKGRMSFKKFPLTCLEAFEGRPLPDLQDVYREVMKEYDGVWLAVNSKAAWEWKSGVWDRLTFDIVEDYLTLNSIEGEEIELAFKDHEEVLRELGYYGVRVSDLKLPDGSCSPPPEPREVKEKMRMIPPGENFAFAVGTKWELRRKGVSQIYRRIHPLKPSYTIVGYGGGGMAVYHYSRSRSALSSREKARLQTFPDSFTFVGSYSDMKAEIGEAVPPLLAKRLAEALTATLRALE